jgi:hypothetical protein
MKTLAAGLLLATTIFTPAYGIDISSTSSIDAVTVFPQGAQVTRIAMFSMLAGENTIILKDLPADVVTGSLRVKGEAQGQMAIGSVDSRKVFILNAAASDAERKRIEDQIQVLFDKRKGLEDALSAAAFRKFGFKLNYHVNGIGGRILFSSHRIVAIQLIPTRIEEHVISSGIYGIAQVLGFTPCAILVQFSVEHINSPNGCMSLRTKKEDGIIA